MKKDYRVYVSSGGMFGMLPGIKKKYESLLRQLYGQYLEITDQFFFDLLRAPSERLIFVISDEKLVATAQVTLSMTLPIQRVYVNNVVVEESLRGQGWGKILDGEITRTVIENWKKAGKIVRMELTNSPKKENAGFYLSCGWQNRGADSEDPTVVWVKDV